MGCAVRRTQGRQQPARGAATLGQLPSPFRRPPAPYLHIFLVAGARRQPHIQVAALQLVREGLHTAVHGEGVHRGVPRKDGRRAVALEGRWVGGRNGGRVAMRTTLWDEKRTLRGNLQRGAVSPQSQFSQM